MLTFDQVLNKYLEYLKKACLNIDASVIHRQSVLTTKECAVGFQSISKYFKEGKIESEFQQLQDKLKKLTSTQEDYDQSYNQLFEEFDKFFFQKTNHLLESKRIFSFFKKNCTLNKTLKDMILLDAINFSATRKRRYLGRYFAHPMMQNRRAKRDDYKPSAVRVTQRCVP
ncbi:hypothetical protein PsalN5692_01857 [Piscirickettsia salmonis]|uniref:hypothetical protein n=2 Tax=Piscirickettsia salmonis TaxID=1238 RepID=UPI0012B751CE|nr:hypothetical protein [Piscirickettsia salmonis]QGP50393.1 hypothetical protein PsalN5692_01857 [Piscirickettsia salmonis]